MENKAIFYVTELSIMPYINSFMVELENNGYKSTLTQEECDNGYTHYMCYVVKWWKNGN